MKTILLSVLILLMMIGYWVGIKFTPTYHVEIAFLFFFLGFNYKIFTWFKW